MKATSQAETRSKPLEGELLPPDPDQQFSGFSTDEAARIRRWIERLSHWMDTAFEVPVLGWRFGWDALIGLIPGAGDVATTAVSMYVIALASRLGMPRVLIARMALNVALDMILGSLPLVGDLFDVWWKANQRNNALLKARLHEMPSEIRADRASDWLFVGGVLLLLGGLFVAIALTVAFVVTAIWRVVFGA